MSDPSFSFSSITVQTAGSREPEKTVSPPILAVEKRTVYVGKAHYALKLKDVTIERSLHEVLDGHSRDMRRRDGGGGVRGRNKTTVLTLSTPKYIVRCTLRHANASTLHSFESFLQNIQTARDRLLQRERPKHDDQPHSTRQPRGILPTKEFRTTAPPKRAPTVTPARTSLYLSPRKRVSSPHRRTRPGPRDGEEGTPRGNVVASPGRGVEMRLPLTSPRNATPTKTFRGEEDEEVEEGAVFERRERAVKTSLLATRFRRERDGSGEEEQGGGRGVQGFQEKKRRRLIKYSNEEDVDSEEEFEAVVAGAKKKLRLSEEDEVTSPVSDREMWMRVNSGIEEEKEPDLEETVEETAEETAEEATKESIGEKDDMEADGGAPKAEDAESKAAKKTRTIHSFFTKQTPKVTKADTFGSAILSSPKKSTRESHSTPPASTDKLTPVLKQVQRTSRYFAKEDKNDDGPEYATDEETEIGGLEDVFYEAETLPEPKKVSVTSLVKSRPILKSYGSKPIRHSYGELRYRPGKLGKSRIGHHAADPSPAKQLDFSGFSAGSTADRALVSSRKSSPPSVKFSTMKASTNETSVAKSTDENKPIVIPGIQNLGNTCYLSASLQTLFGIPHFLLDLYTMYDVSSSKKAMPLTESLLQVAAAIGVIPEIDMPKIDAATAKSKLLASKAANPSALKKQMDVLTDKFAGYEQRDAHEFLSDLVDFLHDELVATKGVAEEEGSASDKENDREKSPGGGQLSGDKKNGAEQTAKHVSQLMQVPPTDDYFHLKVRVCLECDACRYSRSKEEMYRHLSLDVGEDDKDDLWTVQRGLELFFQPEKRELKCEKCTAGITATQTIEIISCPKALLLHFKRFIVTQEAKAPSRTADVTEDTLTQPPLMEMVLKKNKARINLEDSLSIPIFSHQAKYQLRGVVHHVGNTAFSGHYTSCGLRADEDDALDNGEQWVFFDDRVGVKKDLEYVTSNERNQRNCYMALYELS